MTGSAGIGHNNGPSMDAGVSWRRHAWKKARADLLPQMPLEIVRIRVKRAAELGIDYRTYASVRAATGRDIIALLFSSNALRVFSNETALEPARAVKLGEVRRTSLRGLTAPGLDPDAVRSRLSADHGILFDKVVRAPGHLSPWGAARDRILTATVGVPADSVLLVGDMELERAWCDAGRLAGYLPAERYFGR
ncbi:MAG: hypothetical protein AAGF74_15020 [Pseudomonadota bacterium]